MSAGRGRCFSTRTIMVTSNLKPRPSTIKAVKLEPTKGGSYQGDLTGRAASNATDPGTASAPESQSRLHQYRLPRDDLQSAYFIIGNRHETYQSVPGIFCP